MVDEAKKGKVLIPMFLGICKPGKDGKPDLSTWEQLDEKVLSFVILTAKLHIDDKGKESLRIDTVTDVPHDKIERHESYLIAHEHQVMALRRAVKPKIVVPPQNILPATFGLDSQKRRRFRPPGRGKGRKR